jgi:enoyl-CoA hydratase/carnithine racemase
MGLVQEVHADDRLVDAAIALAEEVADNSSLAVQVGKAFINRGTEVGYPESVEAIALLFGTPEHRDAVAAFRARRT